jgi:hypothetical protein
MKNYLNFENRFITSSQKMIIMIGDGFGFGAYWNKLGCDPKHVWNMLHQRIR